MRILNMRFLSVLLLCVFVTLSFISGAYAEQVDLVVSNAFGSSSLVIIVSGLIALASAVAGYFFIKAKVHEARVIKDLQFMAQHSYHFEWPKLKLRAVDCFYRHHGPWSQEDITDVPLWMTNSFWEQHKVSKMLKSDQDHYVNICNVQSVSNVQPILFSHHNLGGKDEGSRVVLSITAKVQNYDVDRRTGNIVKGSKSFKNVTQVWTLELINGRWLIDKIEDAKVISGYIESMKTLPAIEDTLLKPVKVMTHAAE